ncbi:murein hydrolase activator EnvC family protein [Egbenema bharatensis]|uniref:murein hydrolase activator EnvC family protein n=1 Tax=Egbenema bharatensis TaxID=3463334 RepID=UPI003A8A12DA
MRILLSVCCVVLGLVLAIRPALPHANPIYFAQASTPLEDLQQQQQQLDRQRNEILQQRDRLQNQEQSAQERLSGLQTNIQATAEQIAANEQKLKAANEQLKSLQLQLTKAESSYRDKQFATVARLRYLQRQKIGRGWALLLQSTNLNEFLDRRYQLSLVYQADRAILAELRQDAEVLEARRREVESQKNQVALLTQSLQAQQADYQAQASTQQNLIRRLQNDNRALHAAEEQLAKDSLDITALIQQRLAEQGKLGRSAPLGTGLMGIPSDGVLTSMFGNRVHPILGYTRFHAGIDFGADYGRPIWPAHTGLVIFAGWYGGYGQTVIIDHGGGVTTLYAHASDLYVYEGQTVQKGQPIAAIGSTGLSTGPHLHFEVRVQGEPTDPMNYL